MKKLIVQHRRGTKEAWETPIQIPEGEEILHIPFEGELVVEKTANTPKIKIGDGETAYKDLPYITDDLTNEIATERARIDTLVAGPGEPPAGTWENEVADMRVIDGVVYSTAGNALRAVKGSIDTLSNELSDFVGAKAVDGLHYEGSDLYLTAGGKILEDSRVTIVSGGGGGGAGSSIKVRLENLTGKNNFKVQSGDKIELKFRFTSIEDDQPTGDYTAQLEVGGNVRKTLYLAQNQNGEVLDVTDYLITGDNTVRIICTDIYDNTRILKFEIKVIDLTLSSSFLSYRIYPKEENGYIDFRYVSQGLTTRYISFILNNELIETVELQASTAGIQQPYLIPMSKLHHGTNTFKLTVLGDIDGEKIPGNEYICEILIDDPKETAPMIGSTIDIDQIIAGNMISIPYVVYDRFNPTCEVQLTIEYIAKDGSRLFYSGKSESVDKNLQTWSTRDYPKPVDDNPKDNVEAPPITAYFTIAYGELKKTHTIVIKPSKFNVEPVSETPKMLDLNAAKKYYNDPVKDRWESVNELTGVTYNTIFNKFNWVTNGWLCPPGESDPFLRINAEATAEVNYDPLYKYDVTNNGMTIELDFRVSQVVDRNAVLLSCLDSNGVGFKISPDKIFFKGSDTSVEGYYKENERVKVAFSIDQADSNTGRFLSIYLNGIVSNVKQFTYTGDINTSTSFAHDSASPINITMQADGATLDIYGIRIYSSSLSAHQITNNYIADIGDYDKKLDEFEENDIYDGNMLLSYEKVKKRIPVITFTGSMPTYKGDKRVVYMDFENPFDHSRDFKEVYGGPIKVEIDVQGTSSAGYVRKNWKIKLEQKKKDDFGNTVKDENGKTVYNFKNDAYQHMEGQIPSKVFCIKVDYAEGTGTHNTQNANYIETLYSQKIPPQEDSNNEYKDSVRTTIAGFPCVIYQREDETSPAVFSSKGNFNYDKGSEEVFGFNKDYEVECWEFCNNKDVCKFKEDFNTSEKWLEHFEPRYTAQDFDRLEELEDALAEAIKNNQTLSDADMAELVDIRRNMIANFKSLFDWVVSTDTTKATNELLSQPVKYNGTTYDTDSDKYRLAKFAAEFADHFDLHYTTIYYVYTFFSLMIDQRAKNMFLTYWAKTNKWYPYFYDNDSCFGIDNVGILSYDYYHEDDDVVNGREVFNGYDSVLWVNFRQTFSSQIKAMYQSLRQEKLTYDKMIDRFVHDGSDSWSASIYNEDAEYKYLSLARPSYETPTAEHLSKLTGNGQLHLEYFLSNRFKYCDSKWEAGDYPMDDKSITFRTNIPKPSPITDEMTEEEKAATEASNAIIEQSNAVVPPSTKITVTPATTMYCGARYGRGSTLQSKYCENNKSVSFEDTVSGASEVETFIYGASELSDIGDLSNLYVSYVTASHAQKLTRLIIGSRKPGYSNSKLTAVEVSSSKLLSELDISNCPNLKSSLDVSGCSNIQEIYALGSSITGMTLPVAGYLTNLHLPNTIGILSITKHPYLTDVMIGNTGREMQNITSLTINGCDGINADELFKACLTENVNECKLNRVQLTNINWSISSLDELVKLYTPKAQGGYGLKGIDDNGDLIDQINIHGTCIINCNVDGNLMSEVTKHFTKNLKFELGADYVLTSTVRFYNDEGTQVIKETIITSRTTENITCPDPIDQGLSIPIRASTAQYDYEYEGWSENDALTRRKQDTALKNILGDRNLYPAFKPIIKSYKVTFMSGDIELYSEMIEYGSKVVFDSNKVIDKQYVDENNFPVKTEVDNPSNYIFIGWTYPLDDQPIIDTTIIKAQFYLSTDAELYPIGSLDFDYIIDNQDRLIITQYNNIDASIAKLQDTYEIQDKTYKPYSIDKSSYVDENGDPYTGFSNSTIELIDLGENLEILGDKTFQSADRLHTVYIRKNLKTLGDQVFDNCKQLSTIYFNAENASNAQIINSSGNPVTRPSCFLGSNVGNNYDIMIGDDVARINPYVFSYSASDKAADSCRTLDMSSAINCERIDDFAFQYLMPTQIKFPQSGNLKGIGTYGLAYNNKISSLDLPRGLKSLGSRAFHNYTNLTTVKLPASLELTSGDAFTGCPNISQYILAEGSRYKIYKNSVLDTVTNKLILSTTQTAVDDTIKAFAPFAFHNKLHLTEFKVPNQVTIIPDSCFENCSNLTSIELHNDIKELGSACFYLTGLSGTFMLGDKIEKLSSSIFASTQIARVILPKHVDGKTQDLGYVPFLNANMLEEVYILNEGQYEDSIRITTLDNKRYNLFQSNKNLKDVYVGWKVDAPFPAAAGYTTKWGASESVNLHFETRLEAQGDGTYKVTSKNINGELEEKYIHV